MRAGGELVDSGEIEELEGQPTDIEEGGGSSPLSRRSLVPEFDDIVAESDHIAIVSDQNRSLVLYQEVPLTMIFFILMIAFQFGLSDFKKFAFFSDTLTKQTLGAVEGLLGLDLIVNLNKGVPVRGNAELQDGLKILFSFFFGVAGFMTFPYVAPLPVADPADSARFGETAFGMYKQIFVVLFLIGIGVDAKVKYETVTGRKNRNMPRLEKIARVALPVSFFMSVVAGFLLDGMSLFLAEDNSLVSDSATQWRHEAAVSAAALISGLSGALCLKDLRDHLKPGGSSDYQPLVGPGSGV